MRSLCCSIARAMAHKPTLLFADESTGAEAPKTSPPGEGFGAASFPKIGTLSIH